MMTTEATVTDMMFRVFRNGGDKETFALMPGLLGTNELHTCTCYAHMGQHSSADLTGCINRSRPATPEEYKSLLTELQSRGYIVNVIQRATQYHRHERERQL